MQYKDFTNVQVMDHPLIKHKISLLRNVNTGTYEFRQLVEEIATLEGYEALRDLPLKDVEIQTPLEKCMTPMIDGKKLAIVPILRAGLGMVPGVQALAPLAKVGHIGLYRDPETHEPHDYSLRAVLQSMPSIPSRRTAESSSSSCASSLLPSVSRDLQRLIPISIFMSET